MKNHEPSGRFAKGNTVSKGTRETKEFKTLCRQNIYDALLSLNKPIATMKEELEDPNASRWQFIVANAISRHNFKFMQWLFEMGIGRASQSVEVLNSHKNEEEEKLKMEIQEVRKELESKCKKAY